MSESVTYPSQLARVPVKALRLVVTRGPDSGLSFDAAREQVAVGTADGNDLVLADPTVSRYHLEIERRADRILARDLGSTNGTLIGPVALEQQSAFVAIGAVLDLGDSSLRLEDGGLMLLEYGLDEQLGRIRGRSPAMKKLMTAVGKLATQEVAVLVLGESGTGKELFARAIHECGRRCDKPFVTVDCGALSPTLFASELFGHERGAFTGAERQHRGAFEQASGGTLFLDEVGELPPPIQSALLGAIERRAIRRLGGNEEIPVDVRLVCATNRDLRGEVNAGRFRLDLYYRLAVVLLTVPPLRERSKDIPLLVEHFLREAGHAGSVTEVFSAAAMAELQAQAWPGNVRELRNAVEARLALGSDLSLHAAAPSGHRSDQAGPAAAAGADALEKSYREARARAIADFERAYLTRLLAAAGGNVRQAARLAKMDRTYLVDLLRRHDLRGDGQTTK
ncbi:MAG: sigma 54-dependent Fis family transcriptional regulator [Deltaproteobacteria bacterium]|nr:sigma 54-dependent Fis family transcriptional regulator [Deltaproteobacteria bacterium]